MTLSQALGGTGCILLFVIILAGGLGVGVFGEGYKRAGVALIGFSALLVLITIALFIAAIWVEVK